VAAELKTSMGLDAELRVGNSGEFSVWLDDAMIAEKKSGRFPTPDEVVSAVRTAIAATRP
jgi:predicted Rdx family selenoprotein